MMQNITSLDNGLKPVFEYEIQYLFENDMTPIPHKENYDNADNAKRALNNIVSVGDKTDRGALTHISLSRRYK